VVVSSFFARLGLIGAALVSVFTANPALANSSANADIAAPLRAAQAARQTALGNGDEEFRRLFSNWQNLDQPAHIASVSTATPTRRTGAGVSIPSRMPVEGVKLTSGYGMRVHPVLGGRRQHQGIDLAAPTGTPVYATADGVVSKAEWFSSYGLYIAVEHGGDIQTRFGHLSRLNVFAGQQVKKGDLIGYIGSTGRSTGPHLHYEVRIAGTAVNPLPYMQAENFRSAINPASTETGQGGE
jgi:murein DD-endopeptidase MepM/ murein hydrolase activator NlpD